MPKISIIIPVYNTEKHLKKCLDSLVNQTLKDVEIIVVNDGSTDKSQEIINEYEKAYSPIIKSVCQENAGQASARNHGISLASGEYIAFVDSDDYIDTTAYEKCYSYALENNLDIVCFDFWEGTENNFSFAPHCTFGLDKPIDVKYVLNETSPCNKIIRRSLLTENNLFFHEGRIYEDLELIPQLALYTKNIGFIDEPLYYYVIHEGSTMRQKVYNKKLACIFSVCDTLFEKFKNTEYKAELEFIFIEHLLHGAVLRFLDYKEGNKDIITISEVMKKRFPKWQKNPYYKQMSIKYKIVCNLAYLKAVSFLRFLLKKEV